MVGDAGRNALLTGLGRGHSQLDPFAYPSDSEGKPQAVQEPDILEETESSSEDTDGNEITVPLPAKPEIEVKLHGLYFSATFHHIFIKKPVLVKACKGD